MAVVAEQRVAAEDLEVAGVGNQTFIMFRVSCEI